MRTSFHLIRLTTVMRFASQFLIISSVHACSFGTCQMRAYRNHLFPIVEEQETVGCTCHSVQGPAVNQLRKQFVVYNYCFRYNKELCTMIMFDNVVNPTLVCILMGWKFIVSCCRQRVKNSQSTVWCRWQTWLHRHLKMTITNITARWMRNLDTRQGRGQIFGRVDTC